MTPEGKVPLAPRTTLGVGGDARWLVEASSEAEISDALDWANRRGLPLFVLGGGSNLLVADRGFDGLVLRVRLRGIAVRREGQLATVDAAAGEPWDGLVERAVGEELAGLECLSGIPGDVGATPIQNVGAYGQEIADTLASVRALDRSSRAIVELSREACGFGYRDSVFKRGARDRYVVTSVRFQLRVSGAPRVAYAELAARLGGKEATLAEARAAVLQLRRAKSMVLEPEAENGRSAGSFFMNPTVPRALADQTRSRAATMGGRAEMPEFAAAGGLVKLSAGWLIERAGFAKGTRDGRVGLSTKHALAIVNRGGATAAEIVAFAARVQRAVRETFGVTLLPEPVMVGFAPGELGDLAVTQPSAPQAADDPPRSL